MSVGEGGEWRLLEDREGDIAFHMARDEAIFEAVCANISPSTMRLYQCSQPSITLGRFQDIERTMFSDDVATIEVPMTRRVSGGRGILHGDDLIVSIIANVADFGLATPNNSRVIDIYRRTANIFIEALQQIGIDAGMGSCDYCPKQSAYGDCFAVATSADIIELGSGVKLLGAALFKRDSVFLSQLSLPLNHNFELYRELSARVFRGDKRREKLPPLSLSDLRTALLEAFKSQMASSLIVSLATDFEARLTQELEEGRYQNRNWIRKGFSPLK